MDYQKNDYAINKKNAGIVYRSSTGEITVITKDQFLSENSELTEADFEIYKKYSDEDYRVRCNSDHTEERHTLPYCDLVDSDEYAVISTEDKLINTGIESVLNEVIEYCLTETQKRRFVLYCFQRLTIRQISEIENINFNAVEKSLKQAKIKIKKYLEKLH